MAGLADPCGLSGLIRSPHSSWLRGVYTVRHKGNVTPFRRRTELHQIDSESVAARDWIAARPRRGQ
jgi:hypothetical protein